MNAQTMEELSDVLHAVVHEKMQTDVQRYLAQSFELGLQMESLRRQIDFLADKAYLISSPDPSVPKVKVSRETDARFARALAEKDALEQELAEKYELLMGYRNQLVQLINQYTVGKENLILTARYVSGQSWNEMAANFHYSLKQLRRIHDSAIQKITLPENPIWIILRAVQ